MKKVLSMLLAGLMLAGCGTAVSGGTPEVTEVPEEVKEAVQEAVEQAGPALEEIKNQATEYVKKMDLKVLSPSGAPALSLIPAAIGGCQIDFVDGADPLQAALVNPDQEYDIIIAPSNLGLKLAESGKSAYKMLGIVTWGNLYIVGKEGTQEDPSTWTNVAAFGEQSVTGKVFTEAFGNALKMDEVTWYNSTAEASAALIAGNADVAMLAEPNATAAIAKAKENGVDLAIIGDVQKKYADGKGFPQAALFVKEETYNSNKEGVDGLFAVLGMFSAAAGEMDEETITSAIESAGGAEKLGLPNAQVVAKVWKRLNINVVPASEHVEELKKFGELFGIKDVESALIK